MPAKPNLKRYALFGWDYELICPLGDGNMGTLPAFPSARTSRG